MHHAGAGAAGDRVRVLEEGEVGAGAGVLVAVEEVVDARIVLVDGLGGQPQAQHARVEIDVAARVSGDRADVVDAFELHGLASVAASDCNRNYSEERLHEQLPQERVCRRAHWRECQLERDQEPRTILLERRRR
jgi:hypothetical protein